MMLEQVALAVRARWGGIGSDFFFFFSCFEGRWKGGGISCVGVISVRAVLDIFIFSFL